MGKLTRTHRVGAPGPANSSRNSGAGAEESSSSDDLSSPHSNEAAGTPHPHSISSHSSSISSHPQAGGSHVPLTTSLSSTDNSEGQSTSATSTRARGVKRQREDESVAEFSSSEGEDPGANVHEDAVSSPRSKISKYETFSSSSSAHHVTSSLDLRGDGLLGTLNLENVLLQPNLLSQPVQSALEVPPQPPAMEAVELNWNPEGELRDYLDDDDMLLLTNVPPAAAVQQLMATFRDAVEYQNNGISNAFRDDLQAANIIVPPNASTLDLAHMVLNNQETSNLDPDEVAEYFEKIGQIALDHWTEVNDFFNAEAVEDPLPEVWQVLDSFVNVAPALPLAANEFAQAVEDAGVAQFGEPITSFRQLAPVLPAVQEHLSNEGEDAYILREALNQLQDFVGNLIVACHTPATGGVV